MMMKYAVALLLLSTVSSFTTPRPTFLSSRALVPLQSTPEERFPSSPQSKATASPLQSTPAADESTPSSPESPAEESTPTKAAEESTPGESTPVEATPEAESTPHKGVESTNFEFALLFDCDGVIIETEELHRLAYNAAFKAASLTIQGKPVEWSVAYYDKLQNTVGGGKPKMHYHFRETCGNTYPASANKPAPVSQEEQNALIDALQAHKTNLYKDLIEQKATPRPGVLELMDEALADPKIAVGVCSASTKEAVTKVLDVTLGSERREKLNVCILGDDVERKKPDPQIYNTAAERIGISKERCVVIEDSLVGLRAAKAAGMKCVITYTASTETADFYGEGAEAKVPELAERDVRLASIFWPLRRGGLGSELLVGIKDEVKKKSKPDKGSSRVPEAEVAPPAIIPPPPAAKQPRVVPTTYDIRAPPLITIPPPKKKVESKAPEFVTPTDPIMPTQPPARAVEVEAPDPIMPLPPPAAGRALEVDAQTPIITPPPPEARALEVDAPIVTPPPPPPEARPLEVEAQTPIITPPPEARKPRVGPTTEDVRAPPLITIPPPKKPVQSTDDESSDA